MELRARRHLLLGLVGVFVVQTWIVYSDPTGRGAPPLSVEASRGRGVWRRHNCQSCHQVYGFGGFIGPDLTNAAKELTPARLDSILTVGSGAMPAFDLPPDERRALGAYLEELHRTGVSQPRAIEPRPAREVVQELTDAIVAAQGPLSALEQAGLAIFQRENCIDCHLPNPSSAFRATDITGLGDRFDRARLWVVLDEGVPGKAMPHFGFADRDKEALHAWLAFLAHHGDALRAELERDGNARGNALLRLPWFEYR